MSNEPLRDKQGNELRGKWVTAKSEMLQALVPADRHIFIAGKEPSYLKRVCGLCKGNAWIVSKDLLTLAQNDLLILCFDCGTSMELTDIDDVKTYKIECPVCHRVSYNRNDIENGYCGHCHKFTGAPQL